MPFNQRGLLMPYGKLANVILRSTFKAAHQMRSLPTFIPPHALEKESFSTMAQVSSWERQQSSMMMCQFFMALRLAAQAKPLATDIPKSGGAS